MTILAIVQALATALTLVLVLVAVRVADLLETTEERRASIDASA